MRPSVLSVPRTLFFFFLKKMGFCKIPVAQNLLAWRGRGVLANNRNSKKEAWRLYLLSKTMERRQGRDACGESLEIFKINLNG